MSKVDTAWLRLDTEANRMIIHGVLLLKPHVALDDLRARVAERLLRFPRFRQRVVEAGDSAWWVEDADVDITRHAVAETLNRRRGRPLEGALQDRLAELAAEPLDPARPLWQLHLIEHYDGSSALIARVHHCIADGIALIAVLLSITDGGAVPPGLPGT
ncbi:MAG: wax ester/triacylglycerol synthase family O-acyltransferase, partial [Rubrivivax sp.]